MLICNDYIKLLANFPPRPITSEEELELTQNMIDKLLDQGKLNEKDYLNVLGALVYE